MYRLQSYGAEGAYVINDTFPYQSVFRADDAAAAELIVVNLNQQVMLIELAEHRFNFEVAGLTLADGLSIATDRESQLQLSNCFVDLKHGLIPDTDWKGSGWQLVDLDQIEPMAKAVAAHRRGCFRGERLVQTVINDAKTVADLELINIRQLFGDAYQEAYEGVMTPEQAAE